MSALVFCNACDRVHADTRDERRPWRFRCTARPTKPGYVFVHPTYSPDPPYQLCERVNFDGRCPDFTPQRQPAEARA